MKKNKVVLKTKKSSKKVVKKTVKKAVKSLKFASKKHSKKPVKAAPKRPKKPNTAKKPVKETTALPQQVLWMLECLSARKAGDIRLFNVSATAGLWEYFIVCSGTSSVHVSALRDNLKKEMGEKGVFKSHEDRGPGNQWIVVDFGDILVHIFDRETRAVFALEETLGSTEVSLKGIIKR